MPLRRRRDEPEVHRITHARRSHTDDMDQRISRYLMSMAIRTACVLLVFVVPGYWKIVVGVGAVFLPYVAVIMANAGYTRKTVRVYPEVHDLPQVRSVSGPTSPGNP
ncbi:MAG: DUF3099 domain-containing protein [Kineosporiaceae bacterium]|nr:DUF3099 domain-containing protein [Kineosporiaceae bacterium]